MCFIGLRNKEMRVEGQSKVLINTGRTGKVTISFHVLPFGLLLSVCPGSFSDLRGAQFLLLCKLNHQGPYSRLVWMPSSHGITYALFTQVNFSSCASRKNFPSRMTRQSILCYALCCFTLCFIPCRHASAFAVKGPRRVESTLAFILLTLTCASFRFQLRPPLSGGFLRSGPSAAFPFWFLIFLHRCQDSRWTGLGQPLLLTFTGRYGKYSITARN